MAEGDHTENPTALPFPLGNKSLYWFDSHVHVPTGLTAPIVMRIRVPFDCYVREVWLGGLGLTAPLDAITVATVDAAKTIVAAVDQGASNNVMAKQSLHADVDKDAYLINAGDVINVSCDSSGSNEAGFISIAIGVRPKQAGYKGI